ncbi:Fur family transcriptional regulator [Aureimonas leprariae]|uniref:Transcriptional repressor n=1 Tax=Plantimonas leprariae TaxID=2615207 RepID=A0A7V7TW55_9HYPH|nr:Fur family transcriptional regulator [Aureimonas leprariae]KAB0679603.1 transcriptional repressor [Aureimonas leprariae]
MSGSPREGVALTRNQELVMNALERADGPLGAYALLDELRPQGFKAPLQIYRALDKLLETGLVHRLESLNAFVACARPHCHTSATAAFAICERCNAVQEFSDPAVAERLEHWCHDRRFVPAKTTIEIKGVCADCRA